MLKNFLNKTLFIGAFLIISGILLGYILTSPGRASATNNSLSLDTEQPKCQPRQVLSVLNVADHKIYTAKVQLRSGEIAYFGFEPIIDEMRCNKWVDYKFSTEAFTNLRSFLHVIFKRPDVIFEKLDEFNNWLMGIFPNTQKHRQEVYDLVKRVPHDKVKIMADAMDGIHSGCSGFHSSKGDYVAYISKKPINGFFPFPDVAPDQGDFDAYVDAYDNLIMVVSSFSCAQKEVFEHRGIFRNPISMLRKDYQNLGLLIHAFAAYARSEESPEVTLMTVSPEYNIKMRQMLLDNFSSEETIGSRNENHINVKVQALKMKFLKANMI